MSNSLKTNQCNLSKARSKYVKYIKSILFVHSFIYFIYHPPFSFRQKVDYKQKLRIYKIKMHWNCIVQVWAAVGLSCLLAMTSIFLNNFRLLDTNTGRIQNTFCWFKASILCTLGNEPQKFCGSYFQIIWMAARILDFCITKALQAFTGIFAWVYGPFYTSILTVF